MGEIKRDYIVSDPSIMMGKPVIAGTRITVELILEKLSAGETVDQILEAHPLSRCYSRSFIIRCKGLKSRCNLSNF
jgi:uncharacterized protein (DUF433 family)